MAHGLSLQCTDSLAVSHRLRSDGARAELLHDMWDLSSPTRDPARGEALIPTLQGRFVTPGPPGKSPGIFSYAHWLFPFLCELPVLILCPFFPIVLSLFVFLMESSFLHILDINHLSHRGFADVFPSLCLFNSLWKNFNFD